MKNLSDAEFNEIANRVYEILNRRGWTIQRQCPWGDPIRKDIQVWVVRHNHPEGNGEILGPLGSELIWATDPFSVVIKAEEWGAEQEKKGFRLEECR